MGIISWFSSFFYKSPTFIEKTNEKENNEDKIKKMKVIKKLKSWAKDLKKKKEITKNYITPEEVIEEIEKRDKIVAEEEFNKVNIPLPKFKDGTMKPNKKKYHLRNRKKKKKLS
jgi:rRNA maturation endonuclease Nob1